MRDDLPFPGFIYSATAPLVSPLYHYFPVSDRFDYPAIEVASLVAAGAVVLVAVALYTLYLVSITAVEARRKASDLQHKELRDPGSPKL